MTEQNAHLDEGIIHAWLDGALAPDESARIEAHASQCAACGALVAEARGLVAASSRILSSLDAVPAGVIPGATREVDQLAALRARRAVRRRSWFRDPRFVAAASLVFMAGTAGVVWQATRGGSQMETRASSVVADQLQAPLARDTQAPVPSAPPAPSLEAKAVSPRPARDVAASQRSATVDSVPTGNRAGDVRGAVGSSANEELRRERVDVTAPGQAQTQATAPVQTSPAPPAVPIPLEQQSRQQALGGAQVALPRRLSTDTSRVAVTAPAERAFKALTPETGAARLADAMQPVPGCYQLSLTTDGRGDGAMARARSAQRLPRAVPDVVQLLEEQVPVLSDPAWFRARGLRAGADSTLAWRSIDSITVELRGQNGGDSAAVRFLLRPRVVTRSGQRVSTMTPDVQGVTGVVAVNATLVSCR